MMNDHYVDRGTYDRICRYEVLMVSYSKKGIDPNEVTWTHFNENNFAYGVLVSEMMLQQTQYIQQIYIHPPFVLNSYFPLSFPPPIDHNQSCNSDRLFSKVDERVSDDQRPCRGESRASQRDVGWTWILSSSKVLSLNNI